MDGAETIRGMLAMSPHIHVVGYSGDPSNETALLDAGAEMFVVKGTPVGELVSAIQRVGVMERTGEPRLGGRTWG
jgi:DNA-binding NarL/FixJ family response regulator